MALREVLVLGFAGTVFRATDDVHARYEELKERGLEFIDPPTDAMYGIDCSFRDPSGASEPAASRTSISTLGATRQVSEDFLAAGSVLEEVAATMLW